MSLSDAQALRRTLAKRANQRLVRLERSESKVTGENFASYGAAQNAYEYIRSTRAGKNRFSESKNYMDDINTIRREISVLQGFLQSPSSLVSGQKSIEANRISSFESGKWGVKYRRTGELNKKIKFASNKEFYDFLNSDLFNSLKKQGFTSEQIVELYDSAVDIESNEDVISDFEKALEEYRDRGNANLKDLKKKLGLGKPLKGKRRK